MADFTITSNNPEGLIQQLRAIQQTGCGALTKECWAIATQIEEQLKPAIEEPQEFGSIVRAVRASNAPDGDRILWHRVQVNLMTYWQSEIGTLAMWSELTDVEVLRVGVGPEPLADWENELLIQEARRDIAVAVLRAMHVDQHLIDAVTNARPT